MTELKRCPFCGTYLRTIYSGSQPRYYAHPTTECFLRHIAFKVDDYEAIELWNRRVEDVSRGNDSKAAKA